MKEQPTCWTLGWSMDMELGFDDGMYLPRKAALLLYPEYFDEDGNPIKDALPLREYKPKTTLWEDIVNFFKNIINKIKRRWVE